MQRRAFVSRADDQLALELTTDGRMTLRLDKPADERLHLALLTDAPNSAADCGDHFYIQNVERLTVLARFDAEPMQGEYEELIARHLLLHRQAMGDAELLLSDEDRPNEAMLDEAMESEHRRSCMKSCGDLRAISSCREPAKRGIPFHCTVFGTACRSRPGCRMWRTKTFR